MNKKSASIDGFVRRSQLTDYSSKSRSSVSYYKPKSDFQTVNKVGSSKSRMFNLPSKTVRQKTRSDKLMLGYDRHQTEELRSRALGLAGGYDLESVNLSNGSQQPSQPKFKKRRLLKWLILIILLGGGVAAYNYGSRLIKAVNIIGGGNIVDVIFKADPLKTDENSRTNFLIFGTESNDVNSAHGGPLLTDSLMIVSFDSKTNQAAMVSVPRDLWVRLEKTCFVGNRAKVNTVYQCGSDSGRDEKAGAEALSRKLGQITGWIPHYYMHLNFRAVEDIVNAIGGVEVVIESPDPRGIYDVNTGVRFKNGPTGLLTGEQALKLIRARNAEGGYGLSRSNYDREDNQRRVVAAMAQKMAADGTFNDFEKMLKIIESLGDNLRTNITASEVKSVAATFKKISSQFSDSTINSISLVEVTKTGMMDNQSVVLPSAGFESYANIKKHIQRQATGDQAIIKEAATVTVLNGGGIAGMAQKLADRLSEQGFDVRQIANASGDVGSQGLIFQKAGAETPKSYRFIKQAYNLSADVSQAGKYAAYDTDLVVVIGSKFVLK